MIYFSSQEREDRTPFMLAIYQFVWEMIGNTSIFFGNPHLVKSRHESMERLSQYEDIKKTSLVLERVRIQVIDIMVYNLRR